VLSDPRGPPLVDGQHDRVHAPNFRPIPLGWVATTGGRPARPGARHDPAVAAGDEHDQVLVDVLPNINVHVVQRDQVHALPLGVEAGRPLSPGFNPIASWTIPRGRFGRPHPMGAKPYPQSLSSIGRPVSSRPIPYSRRRR
jgi:hypothetical protein